jgi:DNA-binding response OmpR family regulator
MTLEIVQIIEDEPLHARLLDHSLRQARYRTNVAGDGVTGLADVKRLRPSIVLLDTMLPGLSGHEICRRIRQASSTQDIPIIMISALGSEEDRSSGLKMGADDYLTKPFSPREVVSRVGSLLRRVHQRFSGGDLTENPSLSIEGHCLMITLSGRQFTASQDEWRLLRFLTTRSGRIVTVEELASLIWGESEFLRYRELDTIMRRLKARLENSVAGSIEIIAGIGYRFIPSTMST